MYSRFWLGAAAGAVVSVLSWLGNRGQEHRVSVFPDLISLLLFAALILLALWVDSRRRRVATATEIWRAGLAIGLSSGIVLGLAAVVMAALRLSAFGVEFAAFVFLVALGTALVFGAIASAVFGGVSLRSHRFQIREP